MSWFKFDDADNEVNTDGRFFNSRANFKVQGLSKFDYKHTALTKMLAIEFFL